jgi:hypothetical protein
MAITYKDGRVEYEGAVISTRIKCERVMSDIYADVGYATVWDEAVGAVKEFGYAYYFELACNNGYAVVDATEDATAKAGAWGEGRAAGWAKAAAFARAYEAECAAAAAAKVAAKRAAVEVDAAKVGDTVEAKREARGVPKGTAGKVFWAGWSKRHDASWRIGFKDAAGATYWMPGTGVRVTERAAAAPVEPVELAADDCPTVAKGDMVVIKSGEMKGTVGRVIWVGADRFSGAPRVGVRSGGGEVVWTSASSVKAA